MYLSGLYSPVEVRSHIRTRGGNLDMKDPFRGMRIGTSGGNIEPESPYGMSPMARTSGWGEVNVLWIAGMHIDWRRLEGHYGCPTRCEVRGRCANLETSVEM